MLYYFIVIVFSHLIIFHELFLLQEHHLIIFFIGLGLNIIVQGFSVYLIVINMLITFLQD